MTDSEPLKQIRHDLFPAKVSEPYLCSCKKLVLSYRHDLFCLIMILPYSHSLSENYAEVELLWAMTKAVELLRKDFYRKGVCAIADIVKTRQEKTDNKRGIGNRGKTKIVVKEHFSEKGKTMEELLTDVMLEKAKQTIA